MSRRRYVSTNISTDTRVNRLALEYGDFAALLYTWMIPHAADDAGLPDDPEELLFTVIPGRRDKTVDDVDRALQGMIDLGLLRRDPARKRLFFPAAAFYRYQAYIGESRRSPAPAAAPAPDLARTPTSPETAPICADLRQNAPKLAQNRASVSSSVSDSDSVTDSPPLIPPRGDAAPFTRHRKPREPTADIAPISAAFIAAGLRDPLARKAESRYARLLLSQGFTPEQMVECVRDIKARRWGDGWLRDNCCLKTLYERDRMANWADWVARGRPPPREQRNADAGYSQRNHL